ncbi:MAG: hypothetical protein QNJ46_05915 [Leptolyngbyaceae cyanobacterium MO_188.B28]|nr:hypothetical protein [Leptolyngbyaceae cyanobacterium MO_188.B28]
MKVKDVKDSSNSNTLTALNRSDLIQHVVIGVGALMFAGWVVLPDGPKAWVKEQALPVASAAMAGAGFAAKWYNSKAKDGRIAVGDLFTTFEDKLPNPGDFAKVLTVTAPEYEKIQRAMAGEDAGIIERLDAIGKTQQTLSSQLEVNHAKQDVVQRNVDQIIKVVDPMAQTTQKDSSSEGFSIKL